jgi:hypothetical protein
MCVEESADGLADGVDIPTIGFELDIPAFPKH